MMGLKNYLVIMNYDIILPIQTACCGTPGDMRLGCASVFIKMAARSVLWALARKVNIYATRTEAPRP